MLLNIVLWGIGLCMGIILVGILDNSPFLKDVNDEDDNEHA